MVTIKQLAEKAGVSYSSVSRALNNQKGVRPEIRKRILEIAREMNYFPHSLARGLVKNRVGVIGVIIPRTSEFAFQNPFYSNMLLGLSAEARKADYRLMLALNEQSSYASLYYRHLVDGMVVAANRTDDERIVELVEKGIPVVTVPGYPEQSGMDVPSVNSENYKSVKLGVNYLIEMGHRKIAFILGRMNSKYTTERLAAYKAALKKQEIACQDRYLVESDFTRNDGFRLMGQLLDLPDPPTCVICINELVTPGALHQIHTRGLKVPEDISVLAIGSSDYFELYQPPLTTIRTKVVEIGQTAANLLLELIETGGCKQRQIVIPSELIIRESTGPTKYKRG